MQLQFYLVLTNKQKFGLKGVCVCVIFFYDDKAMGTRITLSQLDAAAPSPVTLSVVSQLASLSQTLVGHSVILVRCVCTL